MPVEVKQPGRLEVRPQDVAWLLLFASLALARPHPSDAELELLAAMAVFQIAEPRVRFLAAGRSVLAAIAIKLFLAYLLIGVSGGITSSYYLILIVPVVAAATALGAGGTLAVTLLSAASYLSFLFFLDFNRYEIPPDDIREIVVRLLMIAMIALLTHQLATATRQQYQQYIETARKLAETSRNLEAAEATARRSERLAALGQLTAGLAHELRNPLGTIRASAEVLGKNLSAENEVARELAGYIASEVDRTNSLVTRFLDFARPLQLRKEPGDLNEVVDRAVERLRRHEPSLKVEIHRNYSPDLPQFPFDAELLERVFFNLLLNAAEASAADATISVKTKPSPGGVEVAVIDRGSGIDSSLRESIFNPFFTTKPDGVGLGLAIVSKIVDQHGGRIAVESDSGKGAAFRVFLPTA
jgi:signal transduction histidine kinase